MDLGRVALRGIVGPLFIGHGAQKLFGWFGGHGPDATGNAFESMGLRPGKRHATSAGVAETAGGALLTLGALTPVASALVSGTMITAIRKVHGKNGPWVTGGGYEYNLALIGIATALTEAGPGRPSVDAAVLPRFKGNGLALLQLAAAGLGSYLATTKFTEEDEPVPSEQSRRFVREPVEETAQQTA
jgi:putative oxidoreductase